MRLAGRKDGWEKGREEGRLEERLRQARESLMEDFTVLFGSVPPAVQQQVRHTEDIERLKGWRRMILKAGSAALAEQALLGDRCGQIADPSPHRASPRRPAIRPTSACRRQCARRCRLRPLGRDGRSP